MYEYHLNPQSGHFEHQATAVWFAATHNDLQIACTVRRIIRKMRIRLSLPALIVLSPILKAPVNGSFKRLIGVFQIQARKLLKQGKTHEFNYET